MEIPDSPAAVSFAEGASIPMPLSLKKGWEGDAPETSQKTCKTKSKNCPLEESGQCTDFYKINFNVSST